MKTRIKVLALLFVFLVFLRSPVFSQTISSLVSRVKEVRLKNGITFLVVEDHTAPVVSFATAVSVGSVNDPNGKTGLAHLLEHMAFKGTRTIGTKDWKKEKRLTRILDRLYDELHMLKAKKASDILIKKKEMEIIILKKKINSLLIPNEFANIIERNGGEDLNAQTSKDYTMYYCSLPSNKVELWFYLESNRLKDPVWREFYTEKRVVLEERRMRVDSNPVGKLFENFLLISYLRHPYRNPGIGWKQDVINISKEDLTRFYRSYYIGKNITIAVVGDVDFMKVRTLALKYFKDFPSKSKSSDSNIKIEEPIQKGKRVFVLREKQHTPTYIRGYHVTDEMDPDFVSLDLLAVILGYGRSSRLYISLVKQKKLASEVYAWNGFPSGKYPSLFIIYVKPNKGIPIDDIVRVVDEEICHLNDKGISLNELNKAKNIIISDFWKSIESNLSMAESLVRYQAVCGDWRNFFYYFEKVKKVKVDDIKRVLKKYFYKDNIVEGRLEN